MPTNDQIRAMINKMEIITQRGAAAMLRELLAERETREILDEQSHVNVLKPAHIRRRNFEAATKTSKFKGII